MRKFFILGLVSTLAACGGGGGGKKPDPVPPSSSPVSNSSSSLLNGSSSSIPLSSSLNSSSVSSLGNSAIGSSLSSFHGASSMGSLGNSSNSSTSSVIVVPIDTTPDSFSFPAVTGAALNANITSATITISGINTAAPISIANGEYSIDGGVFTSTAGTITNGQTVVVSLTTATTLGATTQATLIVGGVTQTFSVTTELPDIIPNAFSFTAVTGAALNATISSTAVTISGINTAAPISITGGEYSIAGGAFTSAEGSIANGQILVVRLTSAAALGTSTQATLTVGGVAQTFSVTTELPDTTPDAFSFTAVTGAALNATISSTAVTISGINTAAPISITGGEYSIAGGAFTSVAGSITNGQTLVVRLTTAAILGATTRATVTVGGVARTFSVTTELPDTTPNPFSFTAVTGAALNATISSTAATISGINTAAPIRISGGQYSIAGGAFTSATGSITNGQTLVVRLTSAAAPSATTHATVTVGGVARTFSVTTELPDTTPNPFSFTAVTGAALNATISSTVVTISGINTAAPISITGGEYSIAGGAFTSAAGSITNDQALVVRLTSAAAPSTTTQATLTVGGVAQTFSVTTELPDTIPNAFSFTDVTGAALNATISSTAVTISGINMATPISITGGQYSIAGGAFTSTAGTITNSQSLVVRLTSAAALSTTTQATVTVGGVARTFSVTTELPDTTPNAFSFNTVTGAPVNLVVTSAAITISGINMAVPIGITGGEYSINGGAFTSAVGTVTNGQTVALRLMSAATVSTESQAAVTIGGITSAFSVTTTAIQNVPLNIAGVVTTAAGTQQGADGIGIAARFYSPKGSVVAGGYLYVADTYNNKIRKIEIATGVVTTLAGSGAIGSVDGTGSAASFYSPQGITTDGTHLYVIDTNNYKIRKVEIATGVVTTLAGSGSFGSVDGTGSAASFANPQDITTNGTHLYVADSENNKIRQIVIATGVVTTLAGSGANGSVDGTGTAASFYYPYGITTDGTHLYVADRNNHKIRKVEIATGVVTTLAGSGSFGSVDGTGSAARFAGPEGITTDGTHLYVVESNKIRKIVIATGVVTTLAGSGSRGSTNGVGTAAMFSSPIGIATDGTHLYVADTGNHKIRKVEIATSAVTTLAGISPSVDGTGAAASFTRPQGITTDGTHLYVADTGNDKIRKVVIATGVVTTLAGSGANGSVDGTGSEASFYSPQGITTDGTHLYVADRNNHKIRKVEIATGVVTTLAGSGSSGGIDGTGSAASFANPQDITTDGTHLYVVESNKIRKIVIATGVVTTLAGSGSHGDVDGTGSEATFNQPRGITTDSTHLYVTDTNNYKIRKVEIATGVVTTLAGSGSWGSVDGQGATATFRFPWGITTDGTHLYVAELDNHKIRKVEIATGVVTTLAGSGSRGSTNGVGTAAMFSSPIGIATDGFSLFVADRDNYTIRKIE